MSNDNNAICCDSTIRGVKTCLKLGILCFDEAMEERVEERDAEEYRFAGIFMEAVSWKMSCINFDVNSLSSKECDAGVVAIYWCPLTSSQEFLLSSVSSHTFRKLSSRICCSEG